MIIKAINDNGVIKPETEIPSDKYSVSDGKNYFVFDTVEEYNEKIISLKIDNHVTLSEEQRDQIKFMWYNPFTWF